MNKQTKCPNCGGPLAYSVQKKAIWCEHCESVFPLDEPPKKVKLLREYTLDYTPSEIEDPVNQYMCNNCKTLHFVDGGKESKRCPSCGSRDIRRVNNNTIHPDGIIPFEISKEAAGRKFEEWLKHRAFAPSDLREMARECKVTGVYVPIYSTNAVGHCYYNGVVKKVHVDHDTNTVFSTVHNIRDEERSHIKNKIVCANSATDAELVSKVAGFDMNKMVPFSSSYLFGYYASDTNYSVHDAIIAIEKDFNNSSESSIRSKLRSKYDEIIKLSCNSTLHDITFSYLYTPIYVNHYTYHKKHYQCFVDGVTGKAAGRAPKSAGKIAAVAAGILMVIGAIALLIAKYI